MKDNIPIVYLYFYTKFKEKIGYRRTFLKEFYTVTHGYVYRIPKRIIFKMLKEMKELGLLSINHRFIELKKIESSLLDEVNPNPLW